MSQLWRRWHRGSGLCCEQALGSCPHSYLPCRCCDLSRTQVLAAILLCRPSRRAWPVWQQHKCCCSTKSWGGTSNACINPYKDKHAPGLDDPLAAAAALQLTVKARSSSLVPKLKSSSSVAVRSIESDYSSQPPRMKPSSIRACLAFLRKLHRSSPSFSSSETNGFMRFWGVIFWIT